MLVYRVEHKDTGIGPYHSRFDTLVSADKRNRLNNILNNYLFKRHHVDPSDDVGDGSKFNRYGWLFGFNDELSLTRWFDNIHAIKGLQSLKFIVRVYEVRDTHVMTLKSQVCYMPRDAKLVSEHDLYSFCKQHSEFFA